jgi:tetratricopeptide (TPR) repeat protein
MAAASYRPRGRRLILVVLLMTAGDLRGQADAPRVGTRVVTKYQTPLRAGQQVVDDGSTFRVYTVERADGGWLWLVSGSVRGWVPAGVVVPFDQAIDFYTREVRADPANAAAYDWRGLVWQEKGEPDMALADYDEAIRRAPNQARPFVHRGGAWAAKGEYDRAIADYDQAIRLDPDNAAAFGNRGWVWLSKREYDRAIADCDQAIRLDPKLAAPFGNRGLAWAAKGEYDWAIADYTEASRLDPKRALLFVNRGKAWEAKREYDRAIADFTEAIRLDPMQATPFNNRGVAWQAKGEYDRAIADYTEASRLDPNQATPFNNRAWLWATCPEAKYRDGQRAVESATRACELSGWKDAYNLETLAAAYAEVGDFARAVASQQKANGLYQSERDRRTGEERLALYRDGKPYRHEPGR